ncbi:MAG: SDR family NAD(P)-dependent oxidoreductase [Caulobacteraceae bacterium]|nr:SDR family NAD(P)-dependent oxidoreductase [Caulobacter sp.]
MAAVPSVFSPDALRGKVAVVTGAARGIGRCAAVALAQAGATVAGLDICAVASAVDTFPPATRADLDHTGELVAEAGGEWRALVADQRDIAALRAACREVVDAFGGVDILFANAGVQAFKPLLEMEDADWHDQIDINLTGTANALRAFGPSIKARGGGRIIVTSSTQGQHGTLNGSAYSASKWGILGLMKSAALELGPHGITVNAVIPGLIDTALTRHEDRYAEAIQSSGKDPSGDEAKDEATAVEGLASKLPMRKPWLEPDVIGPAVVFLASDAAAMISGASLAVTGGDSANLTA